VHRSSRGHLSLRVEVAAAYEMILSIGAAIGPPIVDGVDAPGPLRSRAWRFAQSDWMWAHLVTFAAEAPAPRDVEALLTYLERVPALEVLRRLVGFYVPWFRDLTAPAVMDAAIRGDRVAIRAFLEGSFRDDARWQASLAARLSDGPARTKRELLEILQTWHTEVFAPILDPRMRALRAAARIRERSVRGTRSPERIASAFAGWRFVAEPSISRVLVIPSLSIGRVVHAFEHGQTQILCCGLGARGRSLPAPPAGMIEVSRALADPNRVRILRELTRSDRSAQELTDGLGIGLTTVVHHLATLRAAGLVDGGGRRRAYALRREALIVYANHIRSL
jgi:biotin operon repressor